MPISCRFSDSGVGETEAYTLYNENGNKRRVFQNFLDAKTGDKVIGYASTPTLQIVALGEIARETDAQQLYFRKTEQLLNPVDYSEIKKCSELQNMECMAGGGRGTLFKVTPEEYQILMEIIRAENPLPASASLPSYTDADLNICCKRNRTSFYKVRPVWEKHLPPNGWHTC